MKPQKSVQRPLKNKRTRQDVFADFLPSRSKSYDRATGLVYNEVEVSGPRSSHANWISDFATPSIVRTKKRPNEGKGARKLYDMIILKLGLESHDLTVEALESLPWAMGNHIWEGICANHAESFYIWRTFAMAFGQDFADPARRYLLDLKSPSLSISDYLNGIMSKEKTWLVCMRISPKQNPVADLVSISSVVNLTVLDLSDGQHSIENRESMFDSRVMRSWSELASAKKAFQNLRVLMLGWQEKVDAWIFPYLDTFPNLRLLIITRCHNFDHKNHRDWENDAWSHNWTFMPSKRGVKHLRSLFEDRQSYNGRVSDMYYESGRDINASDPHTTKSPSVPLLEVWWGTPRSWTHIMDEYAGTATIYFRKKSPERITLSAKSQGVKEQVNRQDISNSVSRSASNGSQRGSGPRRRDTKHSTASLLAEMSFKGQ